MTQEKLRQTTRHIPPHEIPFSIAERLGQIGIHSAPALLSATYTGAGEVSYALGMQPEEFVKFRVKARKYVPPEDASRIEALAQNPKSKGELADALRRMEQDPNVVYLLDRKPRTFI